MAKTEAAPRRTADHPLNRRLFISDNIKLLRSLDNDSIDLVVTDPPFGKNETFTSGGLNPELTKEELAVEREVLSGWRITNRREAREKGVEWTIDEKGASYDDVWRWRDVHTKWADEIEISHPKIKALIDATRVIHSDSHAAYLSYMAIRLVEIQRVLKPTGSIYLHCDHTAGHYLKVLMDAVFGKKNFVNEIAWGYEKPRSAKKIWRNNHDVILFYSKSDEWTFNPQRVPTLDGRFEMRKPFKRPDGSVWEPKEPGKQAGSWWYDIPSFATRMTAKERTGYPTQKPVALAERMIKASSNPGDVVLDPFAGCAYVPVAAEGLDRQWIACDISVRALTVVRRQFNKFRYSVDEGPVIDRRGKKGEAEGADQMALLATCNVTIQGPDEMPKRTDVDPEPAPVDLELEEPDYFGKIFGKQEMKTLLLADSGWMCWGCGGANRFPDGELIEVTENFHLDHIDPKSEGGEDAILNRAPLCGACNLKKGKKLIALRQFRREVEAEGRLKVRSLEDLPDLAKMRGVAGRHLARRLAELDLL